MEIRIVPVAHVSKKSVERVKKAIADEKPDVVAIELDFARLRALLEKREPGWRELASRPFAAMLYLFQQAAGKWLGMTPGGEMLAAVEAAQKADVPVALVDQEISITLRRLGRIPLSEKLALFTQMIAAPFAFLPNPFSRRKALDLEQLAHGKELAVFFAEFKRRLPHTHRVLVEERDEHIFQRLRSLKAEKVVAVMGAGHAEGIARRIIAGGGERLKGGMRFRLEPVKPGVAS